MLKRNIAHLTADNEDVERSIADANDDLERIRDYRLEWYADEAVGRMSNYLESVIEGQELEEASAIKTFEDASKKAADIVGDAEMRAHAIVDMAKLEAISTSEH
jgi:hypothetical protein